MLEVANEKSKAIIGIVAIDYFKNVGVGLPQNVIEQVISNLKKILQEQMSSMLNKH
jgi:hypothetical protein